MKRKTFFVYCFYTFADIKRTPSLGRKSSGVYRCISAVNYLRHGNFICKSEVIYLAWSIHQTSWESIPSLLREETVTFVS
jgi:hypothetical protein